jgi:hypothetical protein
MIDPVLFADRWRVLVQRFNRDVEPDEANRYYRYLSPKIDTDQMVAASEKLWAEASRWPKPADWLEAAPPSKVPMLKAGPVGDRDPYWQPVHMILEGSIAHRRWQGVLKYRDEHEVYVHDDTGPPFYFPRPLTEVVDTPEAVGMRWIDRQDLRAQSESER